MKKLFTMLICVAMSLSVFLAVGCGSDSSEVFEGDYVEVKASEVSEFSKSVAETQKEIDLTKGIKFEFVSTEMDGDEYEKESIEFKTQIVGESLLMAGKVVDEEKDDGNTKTEEAEIYYNGDTFYTNDGLKKEYVKLPFKQYVSALTLSFGELSIDALLTQYASNDKVKFYMEEGSDFTRVKIEFELTQGEDKMTGKFCFNYNADKLLTGVYADIKTQEVLEKDDYTEIFMAIEAYDGEVELPGDLDTYTPVISL